MSRVIVVLILYAADQVASSLQLFDETILYISAGPLFASFDMRKSSGSLEVCQIGVETKQTII